MAYSKLRLSEEDKLIIQKNASEKTIPQLMEMITPGFTYGQIYTYCIKNNIIPAKGKNNKDCESYRSGSRLGVVKKVEFIGIDKPKEKTYSIGDTFRYADTDCIIQIQATIQFAMYDDSKLHTVQLSRITDGCCSSYKHTIVKNPREITTEEFHILLKISGGLNPDLLHQCDFNLVQISNE